MSQPEAYIDYPCWWTYAIMGKDEEDLNLAAGEIVKRTKHRITFSKLSAHKQYVSLHVEIEVASKEERDRFFRAFQADSRIKFVI